MEKQQHQIETQNVNPAKTYKGTLIEQGVAKYKFDESKTDSYYVKLLNDKQKEIIIWGKELKAAISDFAPGQTIELINMGKIGDSKSNKWVVSEFDPLVNNTNAPTNSAALQTPPVETVITEKDINFVGSLFGTINEEQIEHFKAHKSISYESDFGTLSTFTKLGNEMSFSAVNPEGKPLTMDETVAVAHINSAIADAYTDKLDKEGRKQLISEYLEKNGAQGLSFSELEKEYDKLKEKNPGKHKNLKSFLDDVVGKGISEVIEFYLLVVSAPGKAMQAAGDKLEDIMKAGEAKIFKKEGRIKLDLIKKPDGSYDVSVLPIVRKLEKKRPENDELKMIGYKATELEMDRLFYKGETVLLGNDKNKYFAKWDDETNNIILKSQKAVNKNYVIKEIFGTPLTEEQREKLYKGERITVEVKNFLKKDGTLMSGDAKVQFDPIQNAFRADKFYSEEKKSNYINRQQNIGQKLQEEQSTRLKQTQDKTKTQEKSETLAPKR